jgi:tetratricopeptide (TPR) repeat protein
MFRIILPVVLLCSTAFPTRAQEARYPDSFSEAMPLFGKGLGSFGRSITTASPAAQAYFDQGLQLLYAFTPQDAARSFREAWRADPECAICYLGEAWAWGPYLNGPMGPDDAPRAHAAITKALEHSGSASPVERAIIEAMAVRYTPTHDAGTRRSLDEAWASAIAEVFAEHPEDLDVGTLYGESLMLLEPRRGSWPIDKPEVRLIHEVLESVLAQDLTHPGACHLYIHSTESTVRPEKAEACADHLGGSIPGASHINHMPSHTYNRVGRWGDAVRANIQAWHSDLMAEYGEGFAIYPQHNLHMLLFAASMDGQGAIAIQAGKDYGKLMPDGQFYHALALVRFGRFDEVVELEGPPEGPIFRGLWDFAQGYAHLRRGDAATAQSLLERVRTAAIETPDDVVFRGHAASQLLGVTGGILQAEILRAEGRIEGAITALEGAVELEDALRFDEPEPLNFSARHWLGDALLEAGRAVEAESVFRAALADHPRNGWSLFGLEQALRAQGRQDEASAVHADFQAAWARSDAYIRASVY